MDYHDHDHLRQYSTMNQGRHHYHYYLMCVCVCVCVCVRTVRGGREAVRRMCVSGGSSSSSNVRCSFF